MMVLMNLDWYGTVEGLEELTELWKKQAEKTEGVEFKARLSPWNKKYHWTMVLKVDNIACYHDFMSTWDYDRDFSVLTHGVVDIYG